MLPNHAPLMVAERFKVLEALFPGRIDLGLGRAPGTDPVTSYALRRRQDTGDDDDFLERFQELILFESNAFPEGHPFRNVHAMPADVALPPIWLLGSSGYSAQLAAMVGAGFSFAHHFSDYDPRERDAELPRRISGRRQRAQRRYAILAVAAVCADSDAEAERLAATVDLNFVRRATRRISAAREPGGGAAYPYAPVDRERIAQPPRRACSSAAATVHERVCAADRSDQGRRIDGHHDDLRSRRAPAFLRAAGGGVRPCGQCRAGRLSKLWPAERSPGFASFNLGHALLRLLASGTRSLN